MEPNNPFKGPESYTEKDTNVFFGREKEVNDLLSGISQNTLTLLYSRSGIGKTSLIRAGLLPLLDKFKAYFPVYIRITDSLIDDCGGNASKLVINVIKDVAKEKQVIIRTGDDLKDDTSITKFIYTSKFLVADDEKGERSIIPVLIFDQFEEIFTLNKRTEVKKMLEDIAFIIENRIPENMFQLTGDKAKDDENIERLYILRDELQRESKWYRVVFSFREEYLGSFEALKSIIPSIFYTNSRVHLEPFSVDLSNKILQQISQNKLDKNITEGISKMLGKADVNSNKFTEEVQPFFLSLIGRRFYPDLIAKEEKTELKKRFLSADPAILDKEIVVYANNVFRDVSRRTMNFIEDMLINDDGKRTTYAWDAITDPKIKKELKKLTGTSTNRYLNLVDYFGKEHVEILHDRLLQPLLLAKQKRKSIKTAKRILIASSIVLICFSLFTYYLIYLRRMQKQEKEMKYYVAANIVLKDNPTLAFSITKAGYNIDVPNNKLKSLLNQFEGPQYSFIIQEFHTIAYPVGLDLLDDDQLLATDRYYSYLINKDGKLKQVYSYNEGTLISTITIKNKQLYVLLKSDTTIEIQDESSGRPCNFHTDNATNTVVSASGDGQYFLIQEKLYKIENGVPTFIDVLPQYAYSKDLMKSAFATDADNNQFIVAGYWSGDVFIYYTDGKEIKFVKWFKHSSMNSVVSALAVSEDFQYIVTGDHEYKVQIWKVGNLDTGISRDEVALYASSIPYKVLYGHIGSVNAVAISSDNEYILSGSEDKTAKLWNFKGDLLSTLKGNMTSITNVAFFRDTKKMITADEDGDICEWEHGKGSEVYADEGIVRFCPFDYSILGLDTNELRLTDIYGNGESIKDLLAANLSYISCLPSSNKYADDSIYDRDLSESFGQINAMYNSLVTNKHFKDSISLPNKKLLYALYANLRFHEPELLLKINKESDLNLAMRYCKRDSLLNKSFLIDTCGVQRAINNANEEQQGAVLMLADTLKVNASKRDKIIAQSLMYAEDANSLIEIYNRKYPDNDDVKGGTESSWAYLSIEYLYNSKLDQAKKVIDTAWEARNKYDFKIFKGAVIQALNVLLESGVSNEHVSEFKEYLASKTI